MKYAIVMYFEDETKKIQSLIDTTALACGNTYMKDTEIPPHITICSFNASNKENVIKQFLNIDKQIETGYVFFASIGVFNPYVLFISPVLNEYLFNSSDILNKYYKSSAEDLDINYTPYNWVPHCTVACTLTSDQLQNAFCSLQGEFKAFGGRTTKLVLARCNPYFELCELELN